MEKIRLNNVYFYSPLSIYNKKQCRYLYIKNNLSRYTMYKNTIGSILTNNEFLIRVKNKEFVINLERYNKLPWK